MEFREQEKLVVDANLDNLVSIIKFVRDLLPKNVPEKAITELEVAVEELFVNIASYAYEGGEGKAVIKGSFSEKDQCLWLEFIDEGVPYNPLSARDPRTDLPVEERDIGGLGIFFVKKNVDDIRYEYKEGKNMLFIMKRLL